MVVGYSAVSFMPSPPCYTKCYFNDNSALEITNIFKKDMQEKELYGIILLNDLFAFLDWKCKKKEVVV